MEAFCKVRRVFLEVSLLYIVVLRGFGFRVFHDDQRQTNWVNGLRFPFPARHPVSPSSSARLGLKIMRMRTGSNEFRMHARCHVRAISSHFLGSRISVVYLRPLRCC